MNTFGKRLTFTTFGESHGEALGVIVDGIPAGLKLDEQFIQNEMDRRKPGKSEVETQRKESDLIKILSGTFQNDEGHLVSTGTSLTMIIFNENQKSNDYSNIKDLFRPGHADFTYFHKYGIRDYRGGGRSSARETAARVAAGAIAKLLLKELSIIIKSGLLEIGGIKSDTLDFEYSQNNILCTLDKNKEIKQLEAIQKAKRNHDSVGGVVLVKVSNVPIGLGEPMYHKLDGQIANAMMGLNAVKAVEIGDGVYSSQNTGSYNNDQITSQGFKTNHSGGVLGGISNGDDIITKVYFKPTPSIFIEQQTVNTNNKNSVCNLKGRHDPCVAIRGSIVCESMMALVLADMLLLNMSSKIENIKKVYNI
ncbi:Chorismate synthase [hydrothermal vent metagenome]|uniref:chorismate synthase n=1 Tax=hydrothermal vent metagenome TaxID=652676 RepID=A0A3B1DSF9_9ZZZZ